MYLRLNPLRGQHAGRDPSAGGIRNKPQKEWQVDRCGERLGARQVTYDPSLPNPTAADGGDDSVKSMVRRQDRAECKRNQHRGDRQVGPALLGSP